MPRTARPWEELSPQQRLNRQRNEAAKSKRQNVVNITGEPMAKSTSVEDKKVPKTIANPLNSHITKDLQTFSSSNQWVKMLTNLLVPGVVFPLLSVISLSIYLVWQYSGTPSGDPVTGTVIELLGLIYATIATVSGSRFIKGLCILAIISTIFYTSVILHGGLKSNYAKSDDSAKGLMAERDSIQDIITSKTRMAEELPSSYVTKKQQIMADVSTDLDKMSVVSSKLDTINKSSETDVFAGLIIRILAMFANAYLAHLVIKGLKK